MTARIGSLCTGTAALDLAVSAVLDAHPVWFTDPDPAVTRVLTHHWPDTPNHGDLTTTDWSTVEPVDVVTAGWLCQPWSTAGRRRGEADERAIWPGIAAAVRHLRPRLVILENVPMVIVLGELARVVGDLAALGYDSVWCCLRASDVGAPHQRRRIFIVAADPEVVGQSGTWTPRDGWNGPAHAGASTADTNGTRREQPRKPSTGQESQWRGGEVRPEPTRQLGGFDVAQRGAAAPDTEGGGNADQQNSGNESRQPLGAEPGAGRGDRGRNLAAGAEHLGRGADELVDWGAYRPAIDRWSAVLGRAAPAPTVLGARGGWQLNPVFVEWMMGLPAGWVTTVPGLSRNQQLRLLGNGVVPQQAATALRWLLPQLLVERVAS